MFTKLLINTDWTVPNKAFQFVKDIEDIDFTTSTSSLSAHWTGFFHVYLGVDFKFRAGSTPGGGDVFPQTDVGRNLTYTATGLTLQNFKVNY